MRSTSRSTASSGGDVVAKMEQTGSRITETIVTRGDKVTDTFRENAEHLASTVATQGDAVREMLGQAKVEDLNRMGGFIGY